MTQLSFQTHIEAEAKGLVARIGGYVNQFPCYQGCTVEDINIPDGGYGALASFADVSRFIRSTGRLMKQELKYALKGAQIPRDRKTIIMDAHNAQCVPELQQKYRGILSSNVLEHSPNPIFLLMNFNYLVAEDGFHFHAIPCYRFTFDSYRKPTPVQHFLQDFEEMTTAQDTSHNQDYIDSAIEKHGWQREFHKKYPVAYPYMHFHVFDEDNVYQLFNSIFEDVKVELLRTAEFSDVIVFCSNRLKPEFMTKYGHLLRQYRSMTSRLRAPQMTSFPELS